MAGYLYSPDSVICRKTAERLRLSLYAILGIVPGKTHWTKKTSKRAGTRSHQQASTDHEDDVFAPRSPATRLPQQPSVPNTIPSNPSAHTHHQLPTPDPTPANTATLNPYLAIHDENTKEDKEVRSQLKFLAERVQTHISTQEAKIARIPAQNAEAKRNLEAEVRSSQILLQHLATPPKVAAVVVEEEEEEEASGNVM